MFVSYECISSGWNRTSKMYTFRCRVVDTEFTDEIDITAYIMGRVTTDVIKTVIAVYSKRGLNVAANIALALKWIFEPATNYVAYMPYGAGAKDVLTECERAGVDLKPYMQDIDKYLVLM